LTCGGFSSDDGVVGKSASSVYPPNTATIASTNSSTATVQRSVSAGPAYAVQNTLMRFDTGTTLPDNATVTSAVLTLVSPASGNPEGLNLPGEWYDWGATIGSEDFSQTASSSAFSIPLAATLPSI